MISFLDHLSDLWEIIIQSGLRPTPFLKPKSDGAQNSSIFLFEEHID